MRRAIRVGLCFPVFASAITVMVVVGLPFVAMLDWLSADDPPESAWHFAGDAYGDAWRWAWTGRSR